MYQNKIYAVVLNRNYKIGATKLIAIFQTGRFRTFLKIWENSPKVFTVKTKKFLRSIKN